jgi:hypothetical protein
MLAETTAAVLGRLVEGQRLDESGRRTLKGMIAFIDKAACGSEFIRTKSMSGYSREALQAYRLSKQLHEARLQGIETTPDTDEFLEVLKRDLEAMLSESTLDVSSQVDVSSLRDFFSALAGECLSLDVGVQERVERGRSPLIAQ